MIRKLFFLLIFLCLKSSLSFASVDSQNELRFKNGFISGISNSQESDKEVTKPSLEKIEELQRQRMEAHREFILSRFDRINRDE